MAGGGETLWKRHGDCGKKRTRGLEAEHGEGGGGGAGLSRSESKWEGKEAGRREDEMEPEKKARSSLWPSGVKGPSSQGHRETQMDGGEVGEPRPRPRAGTCPACRPRRRGPRARRPRAAPSGPRAPPLLPAPARA